MNVAKNDPFLSYYYSNKKVGLINVILSFGILVYLCCNATTVKFSYFCIIMDD